MNIEEKEIDNKFFNEILNEKNMKIIEILDESPQNAQIFLLGEFEKNNNKEKFIIKLKKKEFDSESILNNNKILKKICSEPLIYFSNDIYNKFLSKDLFHNIIDIEFIYPINEKVIDKHRKVVYELFTETYEIYLNKTLKHINSFDKSHVQWIHNILEGKAEKILIKTKDFIIKKNYKYVNNDNILSFIGFPFNGDSLRSLRDLNEKHLPLLESFYNEGKKLIAEKYKCKTNEIRAFLHYPPSYYYLHVHYLHISLEDFGACVNRAIDLNEVIQNIKLKSDYYQTISINHIIKVGSKLYECLTK